MSWNIQDPGKYINGPLTVVGVAQFNSNVGINVTPSAWNSGYRAIEIGVNGGSLSTVSNLIDLGQNTFFNASSQWAYKGNNLATLYRQTAGQHQWFVAPTGTAGNPITWVQALTLNNNGALALANGNNAANGIGIAFPATQSASTDANTLDDYEEGTWTPTIAASSGTPTTVTIGTCKYTKIGRQVICTFDFIVVDKGTASGSFIFSLPFTSDNLINCGAFRENGSVGNMGQVFRNSAGDAAMFLYNNVTVWVNTYRMMGTYTYCV